ncbi:MAG: HEPN domain-containing protein [Chloroflexi bacterium]|nr:HEPN domain-containing protein [Chloroflexota bacterium]
MIDAPVIDQKSALDAELKRIVEQLAARPDIEGVIVFGSYAAGKTDEGSDLDLAVIQNTTARFYDRIGELYLWLKPQVTLDLLVYTPNEFLQAKRKKPFFRDQILGKGRVLWARHPEIFAPPPPLTPEEREQVMIENFEDWIQRAREDLRMAELAWENQIWNQACFHSQQAIEKSLKGLIVRRENLTAPFTHEIVILAALLPADWFDDLQAEFTRINGFYAPTRYPTAEPGELPERPVNRQDAEIAIKTARQVVARAERFSKP